MRGSFSPSIIAASIARADTVVSLEATEDSLIDASSSTWAALSSQVSITSSRQ
ncbi:MAG: hypothetical protein M0Z51_05215 [Propionibacterium sp.]|nr:hypothetical protein [Propionibacterium sp.]